VRLVALVALLALAGTALGSAADAYDTVVRSARSLEKVRSVHLHRESQSGPSVDIDYVGPDRYHITSGATELIWIGRVQYVREGGQWVAQESQVEPPFDRSVIEDAIGVLQKATIKEAGAAKLGSVSTHRYEIKTPDHASATVWIGDLDGFTYRIENRKPDGTFDSTLTYSNFNAPLVIGAPPGPPPPAATSTP